jgi:hypothetical protein
VNAEEDVNSERTILLSRALSGKKLSVREIVFLGESSKKLSCLIGSSPFEEIDAEQHL